MRIHFWDGEQKARLRKTQPPPECKNCNKPITYNNSRAWKDKKQPAKNVVTTHSLLNALHTSMHRPNYFSAFPNPLCLAAIRNLALKYFRLGGSRLITGLRCTFWFFSSHPAPPPSFSSLGYFKARSTGRKAAQSQLGVKPPENKTKNNSTQFSKLQWGWYI